MKILITGGAGFIGSHLAERMLADGHELVIVDNFSTGKRENVPPQATVYEMDIQSPKLHEVFRTERPTVVCHHAAQMSVLVSLRDPALDAQTNIIGSLNVLAAAEATAVKQFVFASSGGTVYGEPQTLPVKEDHVKMPLSPYGISKLSFEHYLRVHAKQSAMKVCVFRYANVYGPRQSPHGEAGVIAIFSERMLRDEAVFVFGDGTQERDFVYVQDVVGANMTAITQQASGTFNIGTGLGTSINQIYEQLSAMIPYPHPRKNAEAKTGEVYKIWLDTSLAQHHLGWQARVSLADGLQQTADYFRE